MNAFTVIFLVLIGSALGRVVPNEDEYTLQAIEELRHKSNSRLLSEISEPKCTDQKKTNTIECCLSMKWMKQKRTICIELGFNTTRLQVDFALFFDGHEVLNHVLSVGEICAPLPGLLKKINICAHAYYFKIDTKPPAVSFDACFLVKLGGFFHLRLNCIRLDKKGKFSQNSNVKPESEGILVLNLEEGNVKFDLNNPLPKEVMDKVESGWNIFQNEAGKVIDDAGKFVDNAGKQISDTAKNVENELNKAAEKAKEAVGSIGSTISGWLG
uniref:Heteropteran venom family 2 protein 7 n=1 Tax=Ectomocoris sp. TaxID=3104572 RepID=A0AB38ZEF6_9HEMI